MPCPLSKAEGIRYDMSISTHLSTTAVRFGGQKEQAVGSGYSINNVRSGSAQIVEVSDERHL
jgi:hypothetical protein